VKKYVVMGFCLGYAIGVRQINRTINKGGEVWGFKVVVVDLVGVPERCTRRFAKSVKKNVKFPSSLVETALFTVRNVSQNVKKAAAKSDSFVESILLTPCNKISCPPSRARRGWQGVFVCVIVCKKKGVM